MPGARDTRVRDANPVRANDLMSEALITRTRMSGVRDTRVRKADPGSASELMLESLITHTPKSGAQDKCAMQTRCRAACVQKGREDKGKEG
jgi:hypothetical protein